jgi:subtilisin family serine protease
MTAKVTTYGLKPIPTVSDSEQDNAGYFGSAAENGNCFQDSLHNSFNHQTDVNGYSVFGELNIFAAGSGKSASASQASSGNTGSVTVMSVTLDSTAPSVVSFNPADGDSRVDVGANITITFSESVMAGSGSIEIHAGSATGALVESFDVATSSKISFSGSTLTIDPSASLGYGQDYYVTIASGAVQDLSGNSYAGTASYDFMTRVAGSTWSSVSGHGLLNIDYMLEVATGTSISDAPLYGGGYNAWDWGLNKVQAPDAWQAGYTGDGIVVAVVDSGVLYTHSDLAGNIWTNTAEIAGNGIDDDANGYVDDIYGYDFVNKDGYALDDNGHGTHVAGIIAGLRNGVGVTGVAYDATIMPVKVLGSTGSGSFSNVASGIMYAVNNGADVINLSLGTWGVISSLVKNAITYAIDHGVVVCMASGNDTKPTPAYPAILAQTLGGIAVGAVNSNNVIASFSNGAGTTTPYDYIEAPGVSVYSTYKTGGYVAMSGTSMSTPYVAGAAALLLSAENNFVSDWSLGQLESIITSTATSMGGTALTSSSTTTSTTMAAASVDDIHHDIDLSNLGIIDSGVVDTGHELALHSVELTGVMTGIDASCEMYIV